jgi:RecB family exonuclease
MKPDLLIHPTSLALRQVQRRALERDSFFDGRRHLTLAAFLRACAETALSQGPAGRLRPISDLDRELAIVDAVVAFRASRHDSNSILHTLAPAALEETLAQLIDTIAPLADRADAFLALLAADRRHPKNPALAALHARYSETCRSMGVADDTAINAAILTLLRGDRARWPAFLRQARTLAFDAVRWVAPFQESVIEALTRQLGRDNVIVRHVLTDYEQDWWGGSLMTEAGHLLFGDANAVAEDCMFESPATRAAIEHLTGLREGYAMQDRALAGQARARIGFSCSVGIYGEIEDLARRIAWELSDRPDPIRPEDICLVTRNLGAASDAIMDIFDRFRIPYYFRRGVPVLAVPVVKTLLNLARFSADRERNVFCALLESPWVNWAAAVETEASPPPLEGFDPSLLADDLLRSGVEPAMDDPDRLARRLVSYYLSKKRFETPEAAEAAAARAVRAYRIALGNPAVKTVDTAIAELLARCEALGLNPAAPEDGRRDTDDLDRRAAILNAKAHEVALNMLDTLRRHTLAAPTTGGNITWTDVTNLLNRALENITVAPVPPDESGVWILNPFDVAGLQFKVVILAGLNAGTFPQPPTPSPLFPDAELLDFRQRLQAKGTIPVAALAASKARNSQENLLFLNTLAAARDRLVFSYASHDETGQEQPPSVFFSTLWRLVGWPAWPLLPQLPPDAYDAWRLGKAPTHLQAHWQRHTRLRSGDEPAIPPFKRRPFPGESYLGTVPLPLCRADDECWQRVASHPETVAVEINPSPVDPASVASQVAHGIHVEHQRQAFFTRQSQADLEGGEEQAAIAAAPGHEYAGVIETGLWNRLRQRPDSPLPDFSPTQLERLVACPYQYYLQYVLRVEPIDPNELEPRVQDFGTAIHDILCNGFRMLQGHPAPIWIPGLKAVAQTYRRLTVPAWAIRDSPGDWHLQDTAERPSPEALPLVAFRDGASQDYLAYFDAVTEVMLKWATSGNAIWQLGATEQLNVQRRRIRRAVRNLVRTALDPEALPENTGLEGSRRFPALLEYAFDSRRPQTAAPSLELSDPADPDRRLRLHGKIDRVDLVFDRDRRLRALIVVDYKGAGKAPLKAEDLAAGMAAATDCQLPAYGLAAAAAFSKELSPADQPSAPGRASTPLPVLMHYLSYTLPLDKMVKQCQSKWLGLDGQPLEEAALHKMLARHTTLTGAFAARAFEALSRYERGEFAVAPRECAYCDLRACCRHAANALPHDSGTTEDRS